MCTFIECKWLPQSWIYVVYYDAIWAVWFGTKADHFGDTHMTHSPCKNSLIKCKPYCLNAGSSKASDLFNEPMSCLVTTQPKNSQL